MAVIEPEARGGDQDGPIRGMRCRYGVDIFMAEKRQEGDREGEE